MDIEKHHIEECRKRIEAKVDWGAGSAWQNHDFEALSERIFKETKVSLSVSTLKRLWGKIQYESTPNIATLNVLAQFVGYENWRAFTSNGFAQQSNAATTKDRRQLTLPRVPRSVWVVTVVIIVAFLFWMIQSRPKQLKYDNIVFSSMPVTNTVPNTVIFNYNARDSNADSVFIQQSWDPTRRYRVDKNGSEYTSTYYQPGYYSAKLVLDATVVAEHDIFIESNGWLGTIDREPIPVYATEDKILRDGILRLSDEFLAEENTDLAMEGLSTSFTRVMMDEVVPDDAFQLDVTLKNTFGKGDLVCRTTRIVLFGASGAIVIPLSIIGCVGELTLIADAQIDGKTHDLSAFGVDFSDWVTVQCRVKDKKITILVNGAPAYEGDYQNGIGKVMGTRISFMGMGEVKDFGLKKL